MRRLKKFCRSLEFMGVIERAIRIARGVALWAHRNLLDDVFAASDFCRSGRQRWSCSLIPFPLRPWWLLRIQWDGQANAGKDQKKCCEV
jgi:hypothetical protein